VAQHPGARAGALAVALPLAAALAPSEFTRPTGRLTVSLLQPNVPQDIKFDPNRLAGNMLALREQVLAAPGQLVLTPESVLAVPQSDLDPAYWQSLIQPFTGGIGPC
jgi:apolipoprotein N-acyltransferase